MKIMRKGLGFVILVTAIGAAVVLYDALAASGIYGEYLPDIPSMYDLGVQAREYFSIGLKSIKEIYAGFSA